MKGTKAMKARSMEVPIIPSLRSTSVRKTAGNEFPKKKYLALKRWPCDPVSEYLLTNFL